MGDSRWDLHHDTTVVLRWTLSSVAYRCGVAHSAVKLDKGMARIAGDSQHRNLLSCYSTCSRHPVPCRNVDGIRHALGGRWLARQAVAVTRVGGSGLSLSGGCNGIEQIKWKLRHGGQQCYLGRNSSLHVLLCFFAHLLSMNEAAVARGMELSCADCV